MSKPAKPVGPRSLPLLLLAALALLVLVAERGAAFRVGAPASRRHQAPQRRQQQQQCQQQRTKARLLAPLRSTTEDKAETAAPTPAHAAAAAPATPAPASIEAEAPVGPCKKFPKCDGSMRGKGCDGMGKIQGGIATVPGLGWWPIKVRTRVCTLCVGKRLGGRVDSGWGDGDGGLG